MKTKLTANVYLIVSLIFALALSACSGGGGGGGGGSAATCATVVISTTTPQITGTVCAPGGALAFNAPTGIQRFFAEFFGRNAIAALPGMTPVSGAAVKLIEINSAGVQVGADIATAQTAADGSFRLGAPAGFTPGPRYVVRAIGSTANLDRLVTDLSTQDVDPATQATKSLVLTQLQAAGGNIQNLQRFQVEEIGNAVAALVNDVNSAALASTASLVAALTTEAQNNEALVNAVGNLTAPDSIAGAVTNSGGAPLAGIKIVVRDFRQWVTRAETRTDASGQYSANLAQGDYIVGAMNFTAASTAASEWWTCNDVPASPACGAANQYTAARVTVPAGATTLNFKLEPGARVEGSMTAAANPATVLPGVQLVLRDFTADQPAAFQEARPDGTFRVNVRPGVYTIGTRNKTLLLPYAVGLYNGPAAGGAATGGGGATASEATPMTLAAGNTYTVNFPLIEGGLVSGLVTDGAAPAPNAVTGILVSMNADTGAFVQALRSDNIGRYRLWLRPGSYAVRSRGQTATSTVVAFSVNNNPAAVDFCAAVGRATATLHGPSNTPLSQVQVSVFDSTGNAFFQGGQISNGDGTVELYAQPTGSYRIEYRVDNGSTTVGSAIHDGTPNPTQRQLLLGALVSFDTAAATPNALGTITLPAGGELKGVVTLAGVAAHNIIVQLRSGGVTGLQRFTGTRTQSDGSYSISVPAGTYDRVCAFVSNTIGACPTTAPSAGVFASVDNVAVTANQSNTLNIAIP